MRIKTFLVAVLTLINIVLTTKLSFAGAVLDQETYKLVMFETKNCRYCKLFTQTVLPEFQQSRLSYKVPFQDVDIDKEGMGGFKLKYRILSTPTFTMLNRGKEVGRITGMLSKKDFFRAVRYLLRKAKKAERKYQRRQQALLYRK